MPVGPSPTTTATTAPPARHLARARTLTRLRQAGLSEYAIRTILPPDWVAQALAGREPNTGSPR